MYKTSHSVIACNVSSDCFFKKKLFSDVAKLHGAYKWMANSSPESNTLKYLRYPVRIKYFACRFSGFNQSRTFNYKFVFKKRFYQIYILLIQISEV